MVWWVLQKTGSAVAMGTVMVLTSLPNLVFLLVGGVVVDRFPRFKLLFICDLLRGIVIGAAALIALTDTLAVWQVYVFSFFFGTVDAFFQPAFRAVIPDAIPSDDLPSANSLANLSQRLSGIVGPAAGAAIVALGGTGLAFGLDGFSFLFSAICLLPMFRQVITPHERAATHGIYGDLKEGIQTVTRSPWLWVTIAVAGLSTFAYVGPLEIALPFLIKDHLNAGVAVFGLFSSISSLGAVLAAIWLGSLQRFRRRGLLLYGAWMLVGVLLIAVGLPIGIVGILVAALFIGAANTVVGLVWVYSLQDCVPSRLLGRVTSVDFLGSSALVPVGEAVGGWTTQRLGSSPVFIIGGALLTALVALGLLHPDIRSMD